MRERLGLTQAALARAAGLRQSSLSDVEAGSNARADTLFAIARALGVSVSTLYAEPVEALAPEDATFYRDFLDLAPATRDEIRRYVLFRWLLQEDPETVRALEARRDKLLRVLQEARDEADARQRAILEEVKAEARRGGYTVWRPNEEGTGVVPDP